jgi:hypothetical protein
VNTTVKQNNLGVIKMRIEGYQLFAQLLEAHIDEASTSMNLIAGQPGGKEVVQALHKDLSLAHDIGYHPVAKISWSDLKNMYQGAWVIIQGTKGVGAIKSRGGSSGNYDAVASSGGPIQTTTDSRGGNILDFLKGEIGKLQKFYVGKNTRSVKDKQNKRASDKAGTSQEVTQETLVKKFRPLWIRAVTAAIADVKGHVANMIKNDAFAKAKRKLDHIERLQNGLEALEAGEDVTPDFISSAVSSSVLMAASHYYPETTGTISKNYSSRYSSQFSEGPQQLLKDISAGDTKKLGTVLGFFKKALITG